MGRRRGTDNMTNLSYLQNALQQNLLTEKLDIEAHVVSTKTVSAKKRLEIYQNAYSSRLTEALSNNYPNLHTYLGDDLFYKVSHEYIKTYPSTYRSIRWYGDKLSIFLETNYDDMCPILSELADFEWSMSVVFDAKDLAIFSLHKMASIPPQKWGNMIFTPHPSLLRKNMVWNAVEIWESLSKNEPPDEIVKSEKTKPWVLWRRELLNRFYALSHDEAWAIDAMLKGENFGLICEGLCQWHDEQNIGEIAATFLKGWIESGMIANVEF